MRLKLLLIITVLLATLAPSGSARAATISYQGIALSPAIQDLTLTPTQTSLKFKIRLDNNQSSPVTVRASSVDFKSLNDSGGLAFITSNPSTLEHKYGLANWITLPTTPIVLPAKGGQFVNVTINNRADLSPGGHYAAILFKVVTPGATAIQNSVQAEQIISSLVFVRKTGGEIYRLSVDKASLYRRWNLLSWPSVLSVRFINNGNVQTAPRGYASLNGASNILNSNSGLVLPGSSRLYDTNLVISKPGLVGHYTVDLAYRPDAVSTYSHYKISFFYLNPALILLAFILFVLLLALARWPYAVLAKIKVGSLALFGLIYRLARKIKPYKRLRRLHLKKILKIVFKPIVWLLIGLDTALGLLDIWLSKKLAKNHKKPRK